MIIDCSNELCRIKDMNLYVFKDEKNIFSYVKKLTDFEYNKYYQSYLLNVEGANLLYESFENYPMRKGGKMYEVDKLIIAKKLMAEVFENLKIIQFLIADNELIKNNLHSLTIQDYEKKLFKIIQDSEDFKIGYLDSIFGNSMNK